jgi:N-acetylmuramoyl-L-alanine amidase
MKAKVFILLVIFSLFVPQVLAAKPAPFEPIPNSICIDAGHGGTEPGTSNQEYIEKNVNLDVALLLETKLTTAGYKVFMTRRVDKYMTNADRYNYCNGEKAAILISIHHNGSTNSNTDYTMALYLKRSDITLARTVSNTLETQLNLPNQGISKFASGVLIKAEMPATITEGFFLTSSNEYNLIKNNNRLDQEANALSLAIQSYFNK